MSSSSRCPKLLAPELWLQIADLSSKRSVNRLCRTSHYFLDLLRPQLYREVLLSTVKPRLEIQYKHAALNLLASDPELARCVQVFHVHGPLDKMNGSIQDYYLHAIQNMPSLRSFAITGSIVEDADGQKLLLDTLSRLDPPLTEFYFEDVNYLPGMPSPDFALPFLTELDWSISYWDNRFSSSPQLAMFSTLQASRETIRTLKLKFSLMLGLSWQLCNRLWEFRFLRLESLTIGVWHFENLERGPASPAAFARFVLAHGDTLVELDLGYAYGSHYKHRKVFKGNLRSDALPNLTIFRGHISAFLEMVETRMECLRLLRTLDIASGGIWDSSTSELYEMLDDLDRWQEEEGRNAVNEGGDMVQQEREPIFKSLTCLRLELNWLERAEGTDASIGDVLKIMERCAELFGKTVEVWMADIDFPIEREDILPIFEQFGRLKHICLDQHTILALQTRTEDYVLALAARNRTLEEVTLSPPYRRFRIKWDGYVRQVEEMLNLCAHRPVPMRSWNCYHDSY